MKNKQEKSHHLEQEISWMYFNHRVLQEAQYKTVPLLGRFCFLGIYSNNLDEFFRVRVALLNRIEHSQKQEKRVAQETLSKIHKLYKRYTVEFEETFSALKSELEEQGICILNETQINETQQKKVLQLFSEKLNLHFYPRLFLKNSNFKDINDECVYLAIRILAKSGQKEYALLEVPTGIFGRFIEIPCEDSNGKTFMFLDDVIRLCLPQIFVGQEHVQFGAYAFKVTVPHQTRPCGSNRICSQHFH